VFRKGDLVEHYDPDNFEFLDPEEIAPLVGIVYMDDPDHPDFYRVYWYTTQRMQVIYKENLRHYKEA